MRFRILVALCLSIFLISGAVWVRSARARAAPPALVSVDSPSMPISEDSYALASTSPQKIAENKPLRTTDLVSRQLLSDYMSLAATGQATEQNINALAGKYVEGISTLTKARSINVTDIHIVPDSLGAYQAYANSLAAIIKESSASAAKIDAASAQTLSGADIASLSKSLGSAYEGAADSLLRALVPSTLIDDHIQLTNMYLSNSVALSSLAEIESDPAVAFAGLARYNENLKAEDMLIIDMRRILKAHGQ